MSRKSLLFGVLLLCAAGASATQISLQTTPAGATGIPALSGGTVLDFEGVAPGTFSNIVVGGVTFTADAGNLIWINGDFAGQYNNFGTQSLHNNYDPQSFNTLTIQFSGTVSAFGFFWGASDNQWTLSALDGSDTLIESFLLPITGASNAGDFVGLQDPGIAKAVLSGVGSDFIFIDNFAFNGGAAAAVPEPSGLMLVGAALLGLRLLRK